MADPIHDHPRSPKAWRRGDRRVIDGVEYQSEGDIREQSEEDKKKEPALMKDRHFWRRVPKDDETKPTS